MADITVTATEVHPLDGLLVRPFDAGEASVVGRVVRVAADGDVNQADASASGGVAGPIGIIVSGSKVHAAGTIASAERVGVALWGAIYLGDSASLTPGNTYYVSDTTGRLADAAGTVKRIVGIALSANILLLSPVDSDASS